MATKASVGRPTKRAAELAEWLDHATAMADVIATEKGSTPIQRQAVRDLQRAWTVIAALVKYPYLD